MLRVLGPGIQEGRSSKQNSIDRQDTGQSNAQECVTKQFELFQVEFVNWPGLGIMRQDDEGENRQQLTRVRRSTTEAHVSFFNEGATKQLTAR